ncbi:MAG TPA: sensor histidine kinase [Gemmatimonadaceae bacterium]|nr:sensor histidine kinase [Gemmatimonadaceae bacterium]
MIQAIIPLTTVAVRREQDILLARQRARQLSSMLGFSVGDATRITTAVSEVVRNAFEYAKGGNVSFAVASHASVQEFVIRVSDAGPGIANVDAVLSENFQSRTGMGIGVRGARALMDRFSMTSVVGEGTQVMLTKTLPRATGHFAATDASRLAEALVHAGDTSPMGELTTQNQALLSTLQELERLRIIADEARERAESLQLVAERSMVVRQRFMALTTHELRTPLNAMIGYMELLDMELAPLMSEKQRGFFKRAQNASKHLLGITNDFLDMAQGDAGQLKVERVECAAKTIVGDATSLVTPQAAARDVEIHLVEADVDAAFVGDPSRVRQILVNILGNAVSFTPPHGTVEIIISREEHAPGQGEDWAEAATGPWCVIRIEDSGPGIPPEKLAAVFEPFVQLTDQGQAARKGSGLGLTVSRQLAVLMGGDLTAQSTETGAVFALWLPAAPTTA